MARLEAVTESLSVYGLGRWSGGRPIIWVRTGAALAAVGYAVVAGYNLAIGLPPIGSRIVELAVLVVCAFAFWLARRRPLLASGLVLGAIAFEVLVSLANPSDAGSLSSLLAIEVLVMASGLFLGERFVAPAALAAGLLVPGALALSGRYGHGLQRMPAYDAAFLVVFEACNAAVGLMIWLTLRTFKRVLDAAEERRRLELQLQHVQRLEVLGTLAGGFAHDLKNVLAVTRGVAGLLDGHADPQVRDAARDLEEASVAGAAAVGQLLDVARRDEPQRANLDVAQLAGRLRRLVERLLGPNHSLEMSASGPAPALLDPLQLEQVLLNLAANARDATPSGGSIAMAVRPLERKEAAALGSTLATPRQVLVEVRDQGPGVPPELRDRIFEPYFTSKPRGQGTGLGLAVVRSIARASGGCVALQSEPGNGATFRVFFPSMPPAASTGSAPPADGPGG
jgi:signal transduction histidine kinase